MVLGSDAVELRVSPSADVLARWPEPRGALGAPERERADAFHAAADAADFVAAHLLARECVTALTGVVPVRLGQHCATCGGPHGKPYVRGLSGVHVSWSHSRGHVAAVAAQVPVGVDLETRTRPHDVARLVRRTATPGEAAQILRDGDPEAAYLRMWVAKESLVKVGAISLADFGRTDVRAGALGDVTLTVTEPAGLVVGLAVQDSATSPSSRRKSATTAGPNGGSNRSAFTMSRPER